MNDYIKYRGKCKQMCEELITKDSSLKMVRGHYWCPISNRDEPHWWCVDKEGKIIDPTKKQFLSNGVGGIYTEFNGIVVCAECGKEIEEENAKFDGNYGFCSTRCNAKFVGIYISDSSSSDDKDLDF